MVAVRGTGTVDALLEPERRPPARRAATYHVRAGSETSAHAWFMVPMRAKFGVQVPHDPALGRQV